MRVEYFTGPAWPYKCKVDDCQNTNKTDLKIELEETLGARFEICSDHHAQLRPLLLRALLEAEI